MSYPVLILNGDRDAHTPFENAHKYAEAMRSAGNKDVTVKILADHNHIFLEDRDGPEGWIAISCYKSAI